MMPPAWVLSAIAIGAVIFAASCSLIALPFALRNREVREWTKKTVALVPFVAITLGCAYLRSLVP